MNTKRFNTVKKVVIWLMLIAMVGSVLFAGMMSIL